MHNDLLVDIYTTHFTFEATPTGIILGRYDVSKSFFNKLRIPIFDRMGKYIDEKRYYTYRNKKYHVPIGALSLFKSVLTQLNITGAKYRTMEFNNYRVNNSYQMKEGWEDRVEHKEAFEHLLSYPGHQVGNNLQTGKGKTYLGVKLSILYQTSTLICCDGLTTQWEDNYLEKTNIPKDKIFIIQGNDSIKKLWKKINDKEELPWIFIGSIKTLNLYRNYKLDGYREFPRINELCEALGIGHVIFDEIHLNTHACVLLLTNLNIVKNTFLSATPERASRKEQDIFDIVFQEGMIGGSVKYDKYVDCSIRGYDIRLDIPDSKLQSYGYGYSHVKYESYLLNNDYHINSFTVEIYKYLQSEYASRKEEGDKCIVFVSTVKLAEELARRISKGYPDLDVRTYLASDPIDNLHDADIVVSTPKSCGTGKDIKNLITVINTVSTKSQPQYKQMLGRLRKISGKQCKFIDLINTCVKSQMNHYWSKRRVLRSLGKTYKESGITKN